MDITNDSHSHHISQKFNEELTDAKRHLMDMGGLVEKQVFDAVESLVETNSELAEHVQREELNVDRLELLVDQECTHILAKRQPAASDLRLVLMISKATSDLERIGDEANKIARHAITLCEDGKSPRGYVEVRHIAALVKEMLHAALDAFARFDVDAALDVVQQDKTVDQEYKTALRELITYMMEDPRSITRVMNIMWVLRSLERIGDHSRNVAEYVIYLVKGLDVRHATVEEIKEKML